MPEQTRRDFEFALFPILQSDSAVRYLTGVGGSKLESGEWAYQTLIPRRKKFVIDLVCTCRDGTILHIEQETSPRDDISIRMLDYAAQLAIRNKLRAEIRQIVFYTGDSLKRWDSATPIAKGAFLQIHSLGYLKSKYLIIDAGDPDTDRVAKVEFPAAALGMLTRNERQASVIARMLAAKIFSMQSDQERSDAIVACEEVASLRGWSELLIYELRERSIPEMSDDDSARAHSRLFAGSLMKVLKNLIARNDKVSDEEMAPYLNEELRLPELERLIEFASTAKSASDLLDAANIETKSAFHP